MGTPRRPSASISALAVLPAVLALAACGRSAGEPGATRTASPTTRPAAPAVRTAATHSPSARSSTALAYAGASAQRVQPQPAAGSCHALGGDRFSRPDPRCTPGALNPAVTQATIDQTICSAGWTATVRPPEDVTESEKRASMAAYGDDGAMSSYEYDHFVPLELGGAVNDPRNLWPEPGASPNPKDAVEDELNREVCERRMSLAHAQHLIATDWVSLAAREPSSPASMPAADCTASAQWSSTYGDYDVYVHSNRPDQTVSVTAPNGRAATWHTDSSGYADGYFRDGRSAAGEQITVRVGGATCHGSL